LEVRPGNSRAGPGSRNLEKFLNCGPNVDKLWITENRYQPPPPPSRKTLVVVADSEKPPLTRRGDRGAGAQPGASGGNATYS
ncbi:MAG: hypothetical protein ACO4CS_15810, partial [bacterium]